MSTTRIGMLIEPLDVLFCRDGRPFGESTVVTGGLPQPQTLAGSLRTHILRTLGLERAAQRAFRTGGSDVKKHLRSLLLENAGLADVRFCGPWLSRIDGIGQPEIMLPTPADLVVPAKGAIEWVKRMRPKDEVVGWQSPSEGLRPLWLDGDEEVKPSGGFLPLSAITAYLHEPQAGIDPKDITPEHQLAIVEPRTGIAVNADSQTAADTMIYSIRFVRLKSTDAYRVALYAEMDWPISESAALDSMFPKSGVTITLGGEGRLSRVSRLSKPIDWPMTQIAGPCVLLLISPAHFSAAPYSLPDGGFLGEAKLQAAAVPGSVAISGWDLSRHCPKPTRRFVNAGSVYYLDRPPRAPQFATDDDLDIGYGKYLIGVAS